MGGWALTAEQQTLGAELLCTQTLLTTPWESTGVLLCGDSSQEYFRREDCAPSLRLKEMLMFVSEAATLTAAQWSPSKTL